MNRRGFTLLEVLIAITIIAVLSIFTTQAIQRALQTRSKIQHTIEVNAQMRETLRIMERDINMAFHHRDMATELANAAEEERAKPQPAPSPTPSPSPAPTPAPAPSPAPAVPKPKLQPPPQLTMFVGEAERLDFTALSHPRTLVDEPSSSQQKVGYLIKDCKNRVHRDKTSHCLWRRSHPYLDDDVKQGGAESVLLENVESLQFRYLGEGRDEWSDKWDSSATGPADERDRFPVAVEITLTVNDPLPGTSKLTKTRKVVMQTIAAIRFPNNKQEANDGNPAGKLPQ